jgi:predicted ATPase
LFEQVLDTLDHAAVPTGLLVVIEDLHWADPSSRGLFDFVSRNLRGTTVALMGTVRTDEPDDAGFLEWLAEVQRGPRAIRIDLEPFGRDDLADLVTGVLGERPSAALAGRVYERSGGNAFLAEELLAAPERGVPVPTTVQGLVLARIAGLTPPARGLVRLAAAAGVRVRHGLLAAAGGLGEEGLLAAVRELAENHLLVADPSGEGYAFRHALTREAVYDDLLPGERHQLHRAVARALTDEPGLGPPAGWAVAEAVAEHWFAAGELEPALAASIAAGNAVVEVVALPGALAHYERALALWDRVADPETVTGVERTVVLERAAEAASGAGEFDHAIGYIDAAIGALEHTPGASVQLGLLCERIAGTCRSAGRSGQGEREPRSPCRWDAAPNTQRDGLTASGQPGWAPVGLSGLGAHDPAGGGGDQGEPGASTLGRIGRGSRSRATSHGRQQGRPAGRWAHSFCSARMVACRLARQVSSQSSPALGPASGSAPGSGSGGGSGGWGRSGSGWCQRQRLW